MSLGGDEWSKQRDDGGADRDSRAYAEAHRMLDRYGIAYICRHPEVLLGIAPGSSLADSLWRRYRRWQSGLAGMYSAPSVGDESRAAEARLDAILMEYGETERIFSRNGRNHQTRPGDPAEEYDPCWQPRNGCGYGCGHRSYP